MNPQPAGLTDCRVTRKAGYSQFLVFSFCLRAAKTNLGIWTCGSGTCATANDSDFFDLTFHAVL